ncbi:hypothetical protein [Rossellomorea arthrocnemi]|jgi:hypothetical protein|uniref:hypothetical protein n=1 Tax=Rossellomorea arthrocnemi TaxID=2769542 RepID=UPI001917C4DF|nr:hypothetical protein [Rossellomorea arthrocnemi]
MARGTAYTPDGIWRADTPFVLAEEKQSPFSSTQHRVIELKQQIVQKQQSIRKELYIKKGV